MAGFIKNAIIIFIVVATIMMITGCTRTKTEYVYKSVYPNLPDITYPQTLRAEICKFTPVGKDGVVVGYDKENLKCYLNNQEVYKKQITLYQKKIDMVNTERKEWREKSE